jgi:sensor domain CHASE-containing protein
MSRESAQDVLDSVQRIHKLIDSIEQKQVLFLYLLHTFWDYFYKFITRL